MSSGLVYAFQTASMGARTVVCTVMFMITPIFPWQLTFPVTGARASELTEGLARICLLGRLEPLCALSREEPVDRKCTQGGVNDVCNSANGSKICQLREIRE